MENKFYKYHKQDNRSVSLKHKSKCISPGSASLPMTVNTYAFIQVTQPCALVDHC